MSRLIVEAPINTWWKRKKDGLIYFLKDKGFGNVALIKMYQNEVIKIPEADFLLQANNGNFIQFNADGTLQI
jgi:hypothetical protein